ncbi:MAG: hypothetical protein GWN81_16765, partial [Phycisphaerae bacterium]|nr:hypothetical protein [Phycisphaerae bacterium]NIP54050.1 hypothetical protein [Phycisphaerae bacterium]NIU10464.1 hypothetical protein [Phycisphaerae bacterium]NIX30051.1 hypothetical protein [Phycisphaerae bacterium]
MDLLGKLLRLPRRTKIAILVASDSILFSVCMWAALAVRLGAWWPEVSINHLWLFVLPPTVGVLSFAYLGTYRNVVRYLSVKFYSKAVQSVSLHVVVLFAIYFAVSLVELPRSLPIIYWVFCVVAIIGSRVIASSIFRSYEVRKTERITTVIFGASAHGAELAAVLQNGSSNEVVAFIDDKRAIHGSAIRNIRVYPTAELSEIIHKYDVKMVLLAIPDASK